MHNMPTLQVDGLQQENNTWVSNPVSQEEESEATVSTVLPKLSETGHRLTKIGKIFCWNRSLAPSC